MVIRQLIKGGVYNITIDGPLHIGYFLGPFIYQKYDKVNFRVVNGYTVGYFLQQGGFSGLGRRNDETSLSFSDGRYQINDSGCQILAEFFIFKSDSLIGIDRCQFFKWTPEGSLFR